MALIQSTAIPSGATGYEIEQSLRFNNDDSAYLEKTPSSAGNRKTWTWSAWVQRGNLGITTFVFGAGSSGRTDIYFSDADKFKIAVYQGMELEPTAVFRDPSAWYHILIAMDTTQSTASNRTKMYINGELQTSFTTASYPTQNDDLQINNSVVHRLGARGYNTSSTFDGYLTEVNLIDGTALTPADFGETGDYGEWKPKAYSGSYGTNGFYLSFADGGIMSATGGNSTATDGDFKAASFTSNGTFTPSADGYVECLIVAGGGGGGFDRAAGGGAGGYIRGYLPVTGGTGYSITVGAGGAGATSYAQGTSGSNSVFSTITSLGGGGAAKANATAGQIGLAGGSGGGGSGQGTTTPGAGTAGQGNAGGAGSGGTAFPPGGGGGAGAVGGTGVGSQSGVGGVGLASSITGSSVYRAGGGGAGSSDVATTAAPGAGGNGGGGAGGVATNGATGTSGTANTGGGGGGGAQQSGSGGSGGSGIVIIRYKFQ